MVPPSRTKRGWRPHSRVSARSAILNSLLSGSASHQSPTLFTRTPALLLLPSRANSRSTCARSASISCSASCTLRTASASFAQSKLAKCISPIPLQVTAHGAKISAHEETRRLISSDLGVDSPRVHL